MPHWEDSGWPDELNLETVLSLSCFSLSFTDTWIVSLWAIIQNNG